MTKRWKLINTLKSRFWDIYFSSSFHKVVEKFPFIPIALPYKLGKLEIIKVIYNSNVHLNLLYPIYKNHSRTLKKSRYLRNHILRPCLADNFFAKFICYKFFKNFNYGNLKKIFKIFKQYTSKYSKKHTSKFFLKIFTISCSKILDKYPKTLLVKWGLLFCMHILYLHYIEKY